MKRSVSFLILGVALVLVAAASAGNPGRETIKYNAADQAAARAASLRRDDLRPATNWHGGGVKPDTSQLTCPTFHSDLSSFVSTGASATVWNRAGSDPDFSTQVTSDTDVLETVQMVRREWQVQVQDPDATPCLRSVLAKAYRRDGGTLISLKPVAFPHVATYSEAYQIIGELKSARFIAEFVLLGKGRTEITLTLFGPSTMKQWVEAQAPRLARVLIARIRA